MHRRDFLLTAAAPVLRAQSEQPQTFVYKKAAGCDIQADVFGMASAGRQPVVVWIHGGALIMGSRKLAPSFPFLQSLRAAGFTVVSIDYRLAPETRLPAIIEDVEDAFRWLRAEAGRLHIDPDRVGVSGGSAGGYLTLMTGFCVKPAPKALVSFWGYGDIVGAWYSRPDPFYSRQPAVSRADAVAAVGEAAVSAPPDKNNRGRFYLYCRQQGLWPKEVAGHDPDAEQRWFDRYCPIRNVTRAWPPTMLVHGTADTDVPYQQSEMMAKRLSEAHIEHEFVTVPEGGHGIGNISREERERIYQQAAQFLRKRV